MKNQIAFPKTAKTTRAGVEILVREIAELTRARNRHLLELDETIAAIRQRYEAGLREAGEALAEKTAQVRAWAEENPREFHGLRSLKTCHGVVGWRAGQPALRPLAGWTWDRVLARLKSLPGMGDYIRVKEEVDKQALLADRSALGREALRGAGVCVAREEIFYVEPSLGTTENRQFLEAA